MRFCQSQRYKTKKETAVSFSKQRSQEVFWEAALESVHFCFFIHSEVLVRSMFMLSLYEAMNMFLSMQASSRIGLITAWVKPFTITLADR